MSCGERRGRLFWRQESGIYEFETFSMRSAVDEEYGGAESAIQLKSISVCSGTVCCAGAHSLRKENVVGRPFQGNSGYSCAAGGGFCKAVQKKIEFRLRKITVFRVPQSVVLPWLRTGKTVQVVGQLMNPQLELSRGYAETSAGLVGNSDALKQLLHDGSIEC